MWRYQLDVRELQRLVEFIRMRHRGRNLLFTIAFCKLMALYLRLREVARVQPRPFRRQVVKQYKLVPVKDSDTLRLGR